MAKLVKSTIPAIWREKAFIDISFPPPMKPENMNKADTHAQVIVARAKRRYEQVMQTGKAKINLDNYVNAIAGENLKGYCFVAADEFEAYFNSLGYKAKCVRVQVASGGDHYFTVINRGSKSRSLIVDGTWNQFYSSGSKPSFCLSGTLAELQQTLQNTTCTNDLLDVYKAGLKVIGKWSSYNCFTG